MAKIVRNATSSVTGGQYPTYASDGPSKFIPAVWSGVLVSQTYPATVAGDICNTTYQGEISRQGDTVIIRTTAKTTVSAYEIGQPLNYEVLESPSTVLEINKALTFSFAVDDIDEMQSDIDTIGDTLEDAAFRMATAIDVDLLTDVPTQAGDAIGDAGGAVLLGASFGATAGRESQNIDLGTAGAPRALTKANVMDFFIDIGLVMDEANVPRDGKRCITVPNAVGAMVKRSDLRDASLAGDATSISRNGLIGELDGMMIYRSNLLSGSNAAGWNILASHTDAVTFAAQTDEKKMKLMDNPNTHGQLVRGLMVYGYKVLKPDFIVWAVATV